MYLCTSTTDIHCFSCVYVCDVGMYVHMCVQVCSPVLYMWRLKVNVIVFHHYSLLSFTFKTWFLTKNGVFCFS